MSEAKIAPIPDLGTRTDEITIFAGPCSVESAEQFEEVAECVAGLGLTWIRGGAFKPRTNPHLSLIHIFPSTGSVPARTSRPRSRRRAA